jgi:pyrimidine-nucleoside phosphorylase
MEMVDLIVKKRQGGTLSAEELQWFVRGVTDDSLPDYQVSAMLMAMFLQGLDESETALLTVAMADSGDRIDLTSVPGIKVDKHSTGGVADTTTLLLVPMVAACGVPVMKMSGRGLGFTGGTLDKLESIPGFRVGLTVEEAVAQCRRIGAVIMGQTGDLCPADRKLYALRDVTGTVDSIPLIAASIMSKKIAAGADAVVLDVKCGNGAFMKTLEEARRLSASMVGIGKAAGRDVAAVISSMDQPLGSHVGNALEVAEAIDVLSGRTAGDLLEVAVTLGAHMLVLARGADSIAHGRQRLMDHLRDGSALEKLRELIAAQGGDPAVCDDTSRLPTARVVRALRTARDGFIGSMDTAGIGHVFVRLGGGRLTKGQPVDPAAGLVLSCRIGDRVRAGDVLASVHGATEEAVGQGIHALETCIRIVDEKPELPRNVLEIVMADDVS